MPAIPSLAYPCGSAPRFDPAHVASSRATLCAVPIGGNFMDLLSGRPGTPSNTPGSATHGIAGPCVTFNGTNTNVAISGKATYGANAAPLADTMAVIVVMTSSATQQAFMALGTSGTDTGYSYLGTTASNTTPGVGHQSTAQGASTWAGALNVPVFVAASQSLSAATGATQTFNIVAVRLDTGQTFLTTGTNTSYIAGSRNGTFNIGGRGVASQPTAGSIAAVMASDQFMSLAALQQWASDPWSFWYPQK